jgi:hypothetical protein
VWRGFEEIYHMAKRTKSKRRTPKKTSGSARKSAGDKASGVSQTLNWIGETVNTPLVREAIAAALIAGAGAAAAVFAGQNSGVKKGARSLGTMISDATKDMTNSAAGALAGAATDAVKELMPNSGGRGAARSARGRGSKT